MAYNKRICDRNKRIGLGILQPIIRFGNWKYGRKGKAVIEFFQLSIRSHDEDHGMDNAVRLYHILSLSLIYIKSYKFYRFILNFICIIIKHFPI